MRGRRPIASGALLLALAFASPASAQPARALLVARELPASETAAIAEALAVSLEQEIVTPDGLTERLEAAASELGDDPAAGRRDAALERARAAYVQLSLARAREAYDEALAAATSSARAPASPTEVAQIVFERALVALAGQQEDVARQDFVLAATIAPELAPDPGVYGAAVLRAFATARGRARRGPRRQLAVERAPEDARVWIDGREVPPGAPARVRGEGPHLVTAARPGYAARSVLVRAEGGVTSVGIVLAPAGGAQLARDALTAWRAAGEQLDAAGADVVARAAGVTRIVEARRVDAEVIALVLHAPGSAEPLRSARGARRSWEPRPFHVLAEALAGRVVTAPAAPTDRAPVSLAVSAPSRVAPGEELALSLRVEDPDARLRRIHGECGDLAVERALEAEAGARALDLVMTAPEEETALRCAVRGLDVMGDTLVRFPAPDQSLLVEIRPEGGDDGVVVGLVVGALALVAIGAASAGVWLALNPEQELDLRVGAP